MQLGTRPLPLQVIRTERLLIRPVRLSDATLMHGAMKVSFSALKQWMPWAQTLASLRDTQAYLAHGERIWRANAQDGVEQPLQIMDPTDQIYYGATGIKPANLTIPSFEVGYWVNQHYAEKGFITEAMNALTRYLFDVLKAKRVEINCEENNIKSAKVAERLGFTLEGTLKNHRLDAKARVTHSLIYASINKAQLPVLGYQWE